MQPDIKLPKTPIIKEYHAKLTQTSTNAPVATILHNTLGATPVWAREEAGTYHCTIDGGFEASKTTAIISMETNAGLAARVIFNQVWVWNFAITNGIPGDGITDASIIIRIYQ